MVDCEDCKEGIEKGRRRIRCKCCGSLVCGLCYYHAHSLHEKNFIDVSYPYPGVMFHLQPAHDEPIGKEMVEIEDSRKPKHKTLKECRDGEVVSVPQNDRSGENIYMVTDKVNDGLPMHARGVVWLQTGRFMMFSLGCLVVEVEMRIQIKAKAKA